MQRLASAFNVTTVVEWVEDVDTAVQLQDWGFDLMQGSLYGMPNSILPWEQKIIGAKVQPGKKSLNL